MKRDDKRRQTKIKSKGKEQRKRAKIRGREGMDRFLLNIYIFFILVSLVWVGHEKILSLLILVWLCSYIWVIIYLRRNGVFLRRRLVVYTMYDLPALLASGAAMYAKLLGTNNEWANGMLEIWVHPFFPILELLPSKEIWDMSSTFLISCSIPILMIIMTFSIYLAAEPVDD
jgi:hypothetical protein